ncbi:hypothetical protein PGB90_002313 [Kerria lacca]
MLSRAISYIQKFFHKKSRLKKDYDENEDTVSERNDQNRKHEILNVILDAAKKEFEIKWNSSKSNDTDTFQLCNFEIIKTLSRTNIGHVVLARNISTEKNSLYAVKVIIKNLAVLRNRISSVICENKILRATNFPFIINYKFSFKDNANLYLGMEFIAGGDLFTHLRKAGKFDEAQIKFYAAQIILSLEYLHFIGIIHRDIKPENVMIDQYGYLKIIDFNLAKYVGHNTTTTKCGTRVYMAPELLSLERISYSFNVDWWSLGVLIYEMSVGKVPFEASNSFELLYKINMYEIQYPVDMNEHIKELIKKLLQPKINERLADAYSVKNEPFFDDTDWLKVYYKSVQPPFVPFVKSNQDTSNFDSISEHRITEQSFNMFEKEFEEF